MENSEMIQTVKQLRGKLDTISNSYQFLQPSAELTLSMRSIQLSKMWLGEVLGTLGNENPYPQSKNPGSAKIEPQAQHTENTLHTQFQTAEKEASEVDRQILRTKLIRQTIDELITQYLPIFGDHFGHNPETFFGLFGTQSYLEAKKAIMWLGMELNRIREAETAKQS